MQPSYAPIRKINYLSPPGLLSIRLPHPQNTPKNIDTINNSRSVAPFPREFLYHSMAAILYLLLLACRRRYTTLYFLSRRWCCTSLLLYCRVAASKYLITLGITAATRLYLLSSLFTGAILIDSALIPY
jgi:hypothetical protein